MCLFLFRYLDFSVLFICFDCKFILYIFFYLSGCFARYEWSLRENLAEKNMRACVHVGACANVIWYWSSTYSETKILPSSRNTVAYIEANGVRPVLHIERFRSILGELIKKITILILSENKAVNYRAVVFFMISL